MRKSIKNSPEIINKSKKSNRKETVKGKTQKSFKSLKARITRKEVRKFDIERVGKIVNILPRFVKFYNKLGQDEIIAIKYYKGWGSSFQTELLAEQSRKNKKDKTNKKDKQRELRFPFSLRQEARFRHDISPHLNELLPFNNTLDIKELNKYIETSYKARITLLNRLDKIYDRADCPRLNGDEILFRGMHMNSDIKKLKTGDTYLFKNFISTTVDRNVAERFSNGECLFILMNMKDIPFIYMPNSKEYGKDNFSKFMVNTEPLIDYSEFTLPRNLEFKIERMEKKSITHDTIGEPLIKTFAKLLKVLKKQGYLDNKTETETKTDNTNKQEIIEKNIFPQVTIFYCTLNNWHPREPIIYEEIAKNAKFVLDKNALDSWSKEIPNFI